MELHYRAKLRLKPSVRLRTGPKSRSGKFESKLSGFEAAEHEPDHRHIDKGNDGSDVALEIAGQSAAVADPREGSFDDPALGQHLEMDFLRKSGEFPNER